MSISEKTYYVNDFANSAEYCIKQKDTSYPVFHGCIDWHSAVHGHWALLRAYRFTNNDKFLERVLLSMQAGGMQEELSYLKNNPYFEMPYGRAWFLKLIVEYEIVTKRNTYRNFSDYIAKTLLQYFLKQPFDPLEREYNNLSWAAINLLQYYNHIGKSVYIELIKKHILDSQLKKVRLDSDFLNNDFFSPWGNLSLLLSNVFDSMKYMEWLAGQNITRSVTLPIEKIKSNHHLGSNYSRAWGFWSAYKMTKLRKFQDAYFAAIEKGIMDHQKYKDNYHAYGHWVPQFGMLALTIGDYD